MRGLVAVDGDSLEDDEGTRFRLYAVNAPDRGECLAEEATARLSDLVDDEVTLTDVGTDRFGRTLVDLHSPAGWINQILVAEGLALAMHVDGARTLPEDMERAIAAEVGVWDPGACGAGPLPDLEVTAIVQDPPGPDGEILDEERVVLTNRGPTVLDLTGYQVRDESTINRYTFPDGFALAPGESVTVTSGEGAFGFGSGSPVWNNRGDTVIVLDDQGRIVTVAPYSD